MRVRIDGEQDRAFCIYVIELPVLKDTYFSLGRFELHVHGIPRGIRVVDMCEEVLPLDNTRGFVPSAVSEFHQVLLRNNESCRQPTQRSREPSRKTGGPSRSSWCGE